MHFYPITIIDNFLDKPNKFRKFALNQKFFSVKDFNFSGSHTFPGWRTKDLKEIDRDQFNKFFVKVLSIFHPNEFDKINWEIEAYFQAVPKNFQEGVIHHDGTTLLAGLLYLSPDPEPNSGTSIFFKNKRYDEDKFIQGTKNNDYRKGIIKPSIAYHKMFNESLKIENLFNRLVLYEGSEFHKANNFFGDDINNSRLTLVFFINKINANKNDSIPKFRINKIEI